MAAHAPNAAVAIEPGGESAEQQGPVPTRRADRCGQLRANGRVVTFVASRVFATRLAQCLIAVAFHAWARKQLRIPGRLVSLLFAFMTNLLTVDVRFLFVITWFLLHKVSLHADVPNGLCRTFPAMPYLCIR